MGAVYTLYLNYFKFGIKFWNRVDSLFTSSLRSQWFNCLNCMTQIVRMCLYGQHVLNFIHNLWAFSAFLISLPKLPAACCFEPCNSEYLILPSLGDLAGARTLFSDLSCFPYSPYRVMFFLRVTRK